LATGISAFASWSRCSNAPPIAGSRSSGSWRLRPATYFILKPKHSGFYGTSLELLLERFGARTLILTGFAANICVWFTANDAHMRGFQLIVPADCVASEQASDTKYVLDQMQRVMHADVRPADLCCAAITRTGVQRAVVTADATDRTAEERY
jgi:hypothetical protein